MKRREFIAFLGGATLMWVPAMRHAVAQQLTNMKRIAIANADWRTCGISHPFFSVVDFASRIAGLRDGSGRD
jgi:hypothetical protein